MLITNSDCTYLLDNSDDDCFIVDNVIDSVEVVNKHYDDVYSNLNATAPQGARLLRTNHKRSNIHSSRARVGLGQSFNSLRSISPSRMQTRKLCRKVETFVPKIDHTQVVEGGGSSEFHRQSPTATKNTSKLLHISRAGTVKTRGCSRNAYKRGGRGYQRYKFTRNVSQTFHEAQTRRYIEANHRPISSKQDDTQRDVQDGDTCLYKTGPPGRGAHVTDRSKRRLLSHPYQEGLQKIHEIHCKRNSVPVQSATVWPQYCSQNFHQNSGPCVSSLKKGVDQGTCIFRRLDHEAPMPIPGDQNSYGCSKTVAYAGMADKLPQVLVSPPRPFRVYRPGMGPPPWLNPTQTDKNLETENRRQDCSAGKVHKGQEASKHRGGDKMDGSIRTFRLYASKEATMEDQRVLVSEKERMECQDLCDEISAGTSQVVDTPDEHVHRSSPESSKTVERNFHGCILSWLRSHNGRQNHVRGVDKSLQGKAHQRTGAGSNQAGAANFCPHCGELHYQNPLGQLHYSGVPKETRQLEVKNIEQSSSQDSNLGRSSQSHSDSCSHTGLQKCGGRCPIEKGHNPPLRMVLEHEGVQQGGNLVQTHATVARHDGNGQEQTNRLLHKSVSTPQCDSSGRTEHPLELSGHPVDLSPHSSDDESSKQDQGNGEHSFDLDCSRSSIQTVVSRSSSPHDRQINSSRQEGRLDNSIRTPPAGPSANGGSRDSPAKSMDNPERLIHGPTHAMSDSDDESDINPQITEKPDGTNLTREECIKGALITDGFEEEVIPFVSKPQRDSSCAVYDCHWNKFRGYCKSKGWDPRLTNAQRMCVYLVHLFEGGSAVNSIENTHSALRSVLTHFGYPKLIPGPVKACINSMWKARPRQRKVCTDWNVNHVMDSFLKPPYVDENMDDANICLRLFTIKTAFLTAMACSRRKSELHAFSRAKGFFRAEVKSSGEVVLSIHTTPGFVAKNQKAKNLYPKVTLRSFFHEFPDNPEEALLCPVRAIRTYLERTKDFPNPKSLLFVNPDRSKNTTASSMACWLKSAISTAYKHSENSPHCTPHEIRAVSTSLSSFNYASVEDILEAGTWSHYSTFVDNYLRDVCPTNTDGDSSFRIPLFIAAGSRISNS